MKKEALLEFKRIFELINHKESGNKIDVKKTLLKAKLNILKENDEFNLDFAEFEDEEAVDEPGLVKSGRDVGGKYYANELYSTPTGSSQPFDMAFRMSLVGLSPGIIKQKIIDYNEAYPNEPITTFDLEKPENVIFDRTQRAKLGLLGLPGNLTEINKYSLEFLTRVYSGKLNPAEKKFDGVTKAFSTDYAKKFAGVLLESWLRTAVKTQFIASAKVTFNEIGEIATFTESFEGSIKKIMELLKTKYDPTKSNFNAFAVTVMKNDFKNNLQKITTRIIPSYRDLEQVVNNFKFPYIVKTNKNYRKKIEKTINKDVKDFNKKNWDSLKNHSNARFSKAGLLKGDIYVGFQYLKPADLMSDLLQSNEESLGGEKRSFSPVYLENIFDDRLKSVFKAVLASADNVDTEKRELKRSEDQKGEYPESTYAEDAILRAVGLENIDQESIPDIPYEDKGDEIEREKIISQKSKDFFTSDSFLSDLFRIAKSSLTPIQAQDISSVFNKQNKEIFKKYPQAKRYYLKMLGEILYNSFIKGDSDIDLKSKNDKLKDIFLNEFLSESTPDVLNNLKTNKDEKGKTDLENINDLFTLNSTNIKGIKDVTNFIKKMDIKTKRTIFRELISERKRIKLINKILSESKKVILKENSENLLQVAKSVSQNSIFKEKYNRLSETEKETLLDKLFSAFAGKTERFKTFNFALPLNDLFLEIITYVITKKGIADNTIKENCEQVLLLVFYENMGVLMKLTEFGFGKAKIPFSKEIFQNVGFDIAVESLIEKLKSENSIRNTDSFDPSKSSGKTWLFNIISNKISDKAMIGYSKIMSKSKSLDAPSTGSSGSASDDTDDDFDSGVLPDENSIQFDQIAEPSFDFQIGKKLKKELENLSSNKGFNVEKFIINKYKNEGDFSYIKGDRKIGLIKDNKVLSTKDAVMILLLFIIGDGSSEDLYSEKGFHKTAKFIDYLVKDKNYKIVDLKTREEFPLDNLEENDPKSIRPNRVFLSRIMSNLRDSLQKREKEAKERGSIYEHVRNFVEKYYLLKESKKKAIDLEEERIANPDGQPKVDRLENFIGSQVFGEDIGKIGENTDWSDGMYGVFSYGKQFPIYLYTNLEFEDQDGNKRNKDGKFRWFHNIEKYEFDIDKDGEKEIMSSVEKHKEVLKPTAQTHGLTTATLVSLVNKFMKKNGIKDLSHISVKPGGGRGVHFGDSDHLHDGRKERNKNKR